MTANSWEFIVIKLSTEIHLFSIRMRYAKEWVKRWLICAVAVAAL